MVSLNAHFRYSVGQVHCLCGFFFRKSQKSGSVDRKRKRAAPWMKGLDNIEHSQALECRMKSPLHLGDDHCCRARLLTEWMALFKNSSTTPYNMDKIQERAKKKKMYLVDCLSFFFGKIIWEKSDKNETNRKSVTCEFGHSPLHSFYLFAHRRYCTVDWPWGEGVNLTFYVCLGLEDNCAAVSFLQHCTMF